MRRLRPERRDVDVGAFELAETIVGCRIETDDIGVSLEQRHERQEQAAVQPVTIEIVRRNVGRRDQHEPAIEQALEQAGQDHRVGDILDLELIETEQACFVGDRRGDRRDRIAAILLAEAMDPLVDLAHELVEVDAPLRDRPGHGEELVHEHGLATADLAINVEAARRCRLAGEEPAERTGFRGKTPFAQCPIKLVEARRQRALRRVVGDGPVRDEGNVARRERGFGFRRTQRGAPATGIDDRRLTGSAKRLSAPQR